MPYKIVLDAGHGGADPGAIYQNRQEKDDTLALTLAVGERLKAAGVDVVYTRKEDVYQTPFEKAQIGNKTSSDYFISIHRNSSSTANQYQGVEVLVYDKSGSKLTMAEDILGAMGNIGFREIGVQARPGLVVLRRTKMPALLLEIGFINSENDNRLFDEKRDEIAEAIAGAILGSLSEEQTTTSPDYRVQTGIFRIKSNADRMLYQLQDQGYPAFLLQDREFYKVQVGAFRELGNAIALEQKLRNEGYSTIIVTK